MERLGQRNIDSKKRKVAVVSQDSFYRDLSNGEQARAFKGQFNFDHPGRSGRGTDGNGLGAFLISCRVVIVVTCCLSGFSAVTRRSVDL